MTNALAVEATAITANGGGTFEGRSLIPFEPGIGFAVGIGGVSQPSRLVTPAALEWLARHVAGEYMTTYVGTWLHEDRVYIDAVEYFGPERRDAAIARGAECGQQAIYDFGAKEVITL